MYTGNISPENTVFVILSFEGTDGYSLAGGLGIRVSKLCLALSGQGYETHLFFIGDPCLEGVETQFGGSFTLHRWCQWISQFHPYGVYDGEEDKRTDYTLSIPEYVTQNIALPSIHKNKHVVVLAEEWHTAETICRINDILSMHGLRNDALLLWNANNTYSFQRIDWNELKSKTTITTVSRYMRHLMESYEVESIVIHNGIEYELTTPVHASTCNSFKECLDSDCILFKMARFDPAKGWLQAIETAARLKTMGHRTLFFLRGGIEPYGQKVFGVAHEMGLYSQDVSLEGLDLDSSLKQLVLAQDADIVNITSFVSHDLARILFACSDAVLANSVHEPFGLVGLEAMAAGGTAFVGTTGEDYAHDLEDAVVLESHKAEEIVASILYLQKYSGFENQLRKQARSTAKEFTWERIIENKLLPKLERLEWESTV